MRYLVHVDACFSAAAVHCETWKWRWASETRNPFSWGFSACDIGHAEDVSDDFEAVQLLVV